MENERIEELAGEIIEASNRTTRAIRAFVRFLFIQLATITAAVVLYVFALAIDPLQPPLGLILLALVVLVVGVIISSRAGWSELEASEIPARKPIPRLTPTEKIAMQDPVAESLDRLDFLIFSSLSESQKALWKEKGTPHAQRLGQV
jgi:hypothetical protein